jgi:glyoxylase-like metal-dependent hydrolase (beta-lactamase superfamily II)
MFDRTKIALILSLATLVPSGALGQPANPETLVERSQSGARTVLDRAVGALGGEAALRAIAAVRIRLDAQIWPRLQARSVAPPFEPGVDQQNLLLDLRNRRFRFDWHQVEGGIERRSTSLVAGGDPVIYNHRSRIVRPFAGPAAVDRQFAAHQRRLPQLVLLHAMEQDGTLRSLGREMFEGRPHDVFTFVAADSEQIAVYIDAGSGLLSKYETLFVDPLTGDEALEVVFADYVRAGTTPTPRTLRMYEAGELTLRGTLDVEINPDTGEPAFEVDAAGYLPFAPSRPLPEGIERLADGVFVLHSTASPDHNVLAVEFRDHVAVVEAPGSSAGTERAIARIRELIPGKPIRYVVMTHHHSDHVGGLRSFIAEGASVITTPGNRRVVTAIAAAPIRDRLAAQPRPVRLELVEGGRRVLTDGTRTLELIDIGPNVHTHEMLIAWLPRERILFQGDMFIVPNNDAPTGPPPASFVSFARALDGLGLEPEVIAGVHGRTATIAEFRQRMNLTGAGN